jgi:hypothetical protein
VEVRRLARDYMLGASVPARRWTPGLDALHTIRQELKGGKDRASRWALQKVDPGGARQESLSIHARPLSL